MTETGIETSAPSAPGRRRPDWLRVVPAFLAAGVLFGVARGLLETDWPAGLAGVRGWHLFDRGVKSGVACALAAATATRLAGHGARFSGGVGAVLAQLAPPVDGDTPVLLLFSIPWGVFAGLAGAAAGVYLERLVPPDGKPAASGPRSA